MTGVQDLFVLSPNPIPARNLIYLQPGLGYFNVYSDCPQIPSKAINAKALRVKNWSNLYRSTPEKKRNSILYLTYHFFEGKNALYIFLIFALAMIFNCGYKYYLASYTGL
ncbi:hypothetical protein [Nostoc sp.]|uniref:hypothetical protein n=1 Tax=Nostoc sp. TaxID=1180 RepID=UPI002FF675E6